MSSEVSVVETAQFYLDHEDYSHGSDFESICKAVILMDAQSRKDDSAIVYLEIENTKLKSALERSISALTSRNLGKPYACLDEVFEEARHALETS